MNFLCLIHVDGASAARLTPEQGARAEAENRAFYEWLVANGHNVLSSRLDGPESATVLRNTEAGVSMTDGPYVETKEHLGGFMLIRARDRKEALDIAARTPVLRYGGAVELREAQLADPD